MKPLFLIALLSHSSSIHAQPRSLDVAWEYETKGR